MQSFLHFSSHFHTLRERGSAQRCGVVNRQVLYWHHCNKHVINMSLLRTAGDSWSPLKTRMVGRLFLRHCAPRRNKAGAGWATLDEWKFLPVARAFSIAPPKAGGQAMRLTHLQKGPRCLPQWLQGTCICHQPEWLFDGSSCCRGPAGVRHTNPSITLIWGRWSTHRRGKGLERTVRD